MKNLVINYFRKTLFLRCLIWFWICLCVWGVDWQRKSFLDDGNLLETNYLWIALKAERFAWGWEGFKLKCNKETCTVWTVRTENFSHCSSYLKNDPYSVSLSDWHSKIELNHFVDLLQGQWCILLLNVFIIVPGKIGYIQNQSSSVKEVTTQSNPQPARASQNKPEQPQTTWSDQE